MPQPRKTQRNLPKAQTQLITQQLKTLRKKRGMTQVQLAEKIGLTQAAIASYESGRIRILDITLIDLAKALNVSTDELLGIKTAKTATKDMSLRLIKRMNAIDTLPEATKKYVIKFLDNTINANIRA
jgi:transcriptional regulator with XRE-family HTH domain